MDTLIINESLSQDLIIPDDNTVTIPIQIEKDGISYELLELSTITSNFCKVTKDNNNIILSDFSADQGYIEFEVPYGDDWTINHRVNITRDIKFRPLAFDNRLLKFQDRLLHIRETPHIMYSELMDYAYSNHIETPPTSNLRALNYLYKNLESEGLDMFDLLYNFAYINTPEQFKLLNLWNKRGYDGTAYGGLMWSNNGVQGNRVNGYIDTNFNPSSLVDGQKYQLNNASVLAIPYYRPELTRQFLINSPNGNISFINNSNRDINCINSDTSDVGQIDIFAKIGLLSLRRSNVSEFICQSKDSEIVIQKQSGNLPTDTLRIFANGSLFGNAGISSLGFGSSLTYEQTQIFRSIFNHYLTAIGLDPIA